MAINIMVVNIIVINTIVINIMVYNTMDYVLWYHSFSSCGGGFGIAVWVLECYVVLLDATDLHNVRGCTLTPPYIDEYGEADPGLRSVIMCSV